MSGVIATIPKFQFSSNGVPMVNGTLETYLAGTSTPATTWQDQALTIANTNPIVLDARGECVLWLDSTKAYKFVLKNAGGVVQWTQDNVSGSQSVASMTGIFAKVSDLAASAGASMVGYQPSGTGATSTTVQEKLRQFISVKDFGAKGDWNGATGTDDTAAINKAIAAVAVTGGAVYFPAGQYLTSGGHSYTGVVSKIVSFLGDGPDASILVSSSSTNDVLTINGASQFAIKGIGFDKQTRDKTKIGLVIKNTAYALVEHVSAFGFLNGFYTEDCLTTAFIKPLARFNDIGMYVSYTTLSRPNAITIANPSFSLNDRWGLRANQPASLYVLGGSIEGNGWNQVSFHGGAYISNAGTEGGVGVTFDGVHMEQNHGEADIYIAQTTNAGTVHNILNCSIFPIDNTHYTANRVYVENSVQVNLNIHGNSFKHFGSYTPNAARKYVSAVSTALLTVNTSGDSAQFYDATETPGIYAWGDNVVRQSMLIARASVAINGTPAAVFVGTPYNIATVTRNSQGNVTCTFAKARSSADYQVMITPKDVAKVVACTSKTTTGFVVDTRDLVGAVQDAAFDVLVA